MEIIREKTVCFTGHRPEKLPTGINEIKVIKSILYKEINAALVDGFDTFITGMQRGVDLWAGEAVLSLCTQYPLRLVAVIPYKKMCDSYKGADKWSCGRILSAAADVVYISEEYSPVCMKMRNQYMVDRSARLIGIMGSGRSGTGMTVRYAKSKGIDVRCIDINELFGYETEKTSSQEQLTLL